MNSQQLGKILDGLCQAEQDSVLPRLHESTVFVSWASAAQAELLAEMIREEDEHMQWLVDAMAELGESPSPYTADIDTTSMHFVALDMMMPSVLSSKRALVRAYEQAVQRVDGSRSIQNLVAKILARHQAHQHKLVELIEVNSDSANA